MRFDAGRVRELLRVLDEAVETSPGDRRSVTLVSEVFERAGWHVESRPVFGKGLSATWKPWVETLGTVVLTGAGLGLALGWRRPGMAPPALFLLACLWASLVDWAWPRLVGLLGRRGESLNLIAARGSSEHASSRVIFAASLEEQPVGSPNSPRPARTLLLVCLLAMPAVVGLAAWHGHRLAPSGSVGLCVVVWLWLVFRTIVELRDLPPQRIVPDHSGLAVLTELARTWPRRHDGRIDTYFVALGGHDLGQAGARALARTVREEWPPRPTLLVALHKVGGGERLAIYEEVTPELAERAARELWVPYRVAWRPPAELASWPVRASELPRVILVGGSREIGPHRVDAAALARVGQLAAEVALRWAKRAESAQAEERATRDKSVQNPG